MLKCEDGLFISVDYTGKLDNGEIFDSSIGRTPLEFQMGSGQLIAGFENAVMGMAINEKKVILIPPEEAYGARCDEHVHQFPRADIPEGIEPEVGQVVTLNSQDGHEMHAVISAIDDENVTFDLNHPLAGKALTFEIEVVGISASPTQQHQCGSGCDCSSDCC